MVNFGIQRFRLDLCKHVYVILHKLDRTVLQNVEQLVMDGQDDRPVIMVNAYMAFDPKS